MSDVRLAADRIALAVEALIWTLRDDPRVHRAYAAWITRVFAGSLNVGAGRRVLLLDAVKTSMRQNKPADLVTLTRLVTDDLGLSIYAAWLPSYLLADFGQQLAAQLTGHPSGIRVQPDVSLPKAHRRLKFDGQYVAEYVRDYYRAAIQQPRDTRYAIAKGYFDAKKTMSVDVASVKKHIKEAKAWLAAVELAPKL